MWTSDLQRYSVTATIRFILLHFNKLITYIHNWSLQYFFQDYDLASYTTYVVCVNFIHEWQDLQFKENSERQIFENLFSEFLLKTETAFVLLEISVLGLMSNKPAMAIRLANYSDKFHWYCSVSIIKIPYFTCNMYLWECIYSWNSLRSHKFQEYVSKSYYTEYNRRAQNQVQLYSISLQYSV